MGQVGLPRWLSGKESVCQCRETQGMQVCSLGQDDPWRKKWQPTQISLLGKSPWTVEPGRLQSTGFQSRTWLSDKRVWQFDIDIHYERISLIKLINTSITSHSYSFFGEMIILDKRTIHQSMNNFFFPHHQVRWNREAYQYTLRRSFKNNFQNAWGIL